MSQERLFKIRNIGAVVNLFFDTLGFRRLTKLPLYLFSDLAEILWADTKALL
jgi:hypothetical protein